MRYKWRQWVIFDCNWKTALEAFMEPYHVAGTHPQLLKYGQYYAYSAAHGLHGVSGFDERDPAMKMKQSSTITRAGLGSDARVSTYELQSEVYTTVNNASTTETLVNAAKRLVDELPEGTSPDQVIKHWLASARADDAARGVIWPTITPQQMSDAGLAWHRLSEHVDSARHHLCAVLSRAAVRRRSPQVHFRILRDRALSRRARSPRRTGSMRNRRGRNGARCSRRISRTWRRCRRV